MRTLLGAACLLMAGCASIPPIQIQSEPETEFQHKLEHDPRFRQLIDQINLAAQPGTSVKVSRERDAKTGAVVGWAVLVTNHQRW